MSHYYAKFKENLKKIHAWAQMQVPLWPLKTCNEDIWQTITASSLKLHQPIEGDK